MAAPNGKCLHRLGLSGYSQIQLRRKTPLLFAILQSSYVLLFIHGYVGAIDFLSAALVQGVAIDCGIQGFGGSFSQRPKRQSHSIRFLSLKELSINVRFRDNGVSNDSCP